MADMIFTACWIVSNADGTVRALFRHLHEATEYISNTEFDGNIIGLQLSNRKVEVRIG